MTVGKEIWINLFPVVTEANQRNPRKPRTALNWVPPECHMYLHPSCSVSTRSTTKGSIVAQPVAAGSNSSAYRRWKWISTAMLRASSALETACARYLEMSGQPMQDQHSLLHSTLASEPQILKRQIMGSRKLQPHQIVTGVRLTAIGETSPHAGLCGCSRRSQCQADCSGLLR